MVCMILAGKDHPNSDTELACFFCNTSDWAFGPVFYGGREEAEAFAEWLGSDPRRFTFSELEARYSAWRKEHPR